MISKTTYDILATCTIKYFQIQLIKQKRSYFIKMQSTTIGNLGGIKKAGIHRTVAIDMFLNEIEEHLSLKAGND